MENASLLVVAVAEQCRSLIRKQDTADSDLPQALHAKHLLWMCDRIEKHAEDWPPTAAERSYVGPGRRERSNHMVAIGLPADRRAIIVQVADVSNLFAKQRRGHE